jgi:hypothetical protein
MLRCMTDQRWGWQAGGKEDSAQGVGTEKERVGEAVKAAEARYLGVVSG